jgi:hypothetical protein
MRRKEELTGEGKEKQERKRRERKEELVKIAKTEVTKERRRVGDWGECYQMCSRSGRGSS